MHGGESIPLLKTAVSATLAANGEVIEDDLEILAKVSRRDRPQAVVGIFRQVFQPLSAFQADRALLVALHRVRDPET